MDIYQKTNIWPFAIAKAILKKINYKTPKKGFVLFETGYGPSGLPHIGTFGEVARTTMVIQAFKKLAPLIPTKLICFSDDLDALRKIPENMPEQEMLKENLGKSLTNIPDPFGKEKSYGDNMNNRLKAFLDKFGFEYDFYSSTECYQKGIFNNSLKKIVDNYPEIQDLVAKTLGEERRQNYHPLMPICSKTGKVLEKGVLNVNQEDYSIEFLDFFGEKQKSSILDGNCKLQWKPDFGMRWHSLEVDFEMYGKDIIPSAELASKISKILGQKSPYNFHYELFLDEKGQKISKSKGNGLTIDEWLRYAPAESLFYYMFLKPKTAKKLFFDIIPKATDEYLNHLKKYDDLPEDKKIENPIYYIHQENPQKIEIGNLTFSLLLNLASACNPENDGILWGFISKYDKNLKKGNCSFFDNLVHLSINYYDDFIKKHKVFRKAEKIEQEAILRLKKILIENINETDAKILQNLVYDIGNEFGFELKNWFAALYEILLGQKTGPRMGSFIALLGINNMIKLIEKKIS